MATLHFWHKPGCSTNARQIEALRAAGHVVHPHNLLTEPWTAQRLLDFFIDLPIEQWFNPAAPVIRSGELSPALLDSGSALRTLIAEPLLIRRPLIEGEGLRVAGFDAARLGLADDPGSGCSGSPDICQP
ncbi:hypothetical protein ACFONG_14520 [Uliginosibacterium paludis]|uniref:Arsenate reductase family protein n=1 Tax=Uliginosibacterium paludis TaxID=1615952 RepID=A0ABV2CVN0_9RHOO